MCKLQDRVVLVGLGGATCSGKSTIVKHLLKILPNSFTIQQDDFAPPEELVPIHPVLGIPDWDSPQGAIDWPRLRTFLNGVKENGAIPPDHKAQACLSEEKNTTISDSVFQALRARFQVVEEEQRKKGIRILWGFVDGFLLYWDKETIGLLDVRFFLRVPCDILQDRRDKRNKFYESVGYNPWGAPWLDPPGYWDDIVYPAYVEAHRDLFENGDIENGKVIWNKVPGLVLIEPVEMCMDDIARVCCDVLLNFVYALGV